jgi:hypothetical protein
MVFLVSAPLQVSREYAKISMSRLSLKQTRKTQYYSVKGIKTPGGKVKMANSDMGIIVLVQQHQSIQAHLKFLIHSVGRLDPQSCRGLAESAALTDRIALYRWSLYDFKEAMKRHNELDSRIFQDNRSIDRLLKEHEVILGKINNAIELADIVAKTKLFREELNVYLVKIALAINTICEAIELHTSKEDELIKQYKKTRIAPGR